MIELPEVVTLSRQIAETCRGRTVVSLKAGHSPHKFAWFYGDVTRYQSAVGR